MLGGSIRCDRLIDSVKLFTACLPPRIDPPIRLRLMETVYLIHLSQPLSPKHTCQHYIGYSTIFEHRIRLHKRGKGSKLLKAAKERNISWEVVRVWNVEDGKGRELETKLKKQHGSRLCPICRPKYNEYIRNRAGRKREHGSG